MAKSELNSFHALSSIQHQQQLRLFSLVSALCPPRQDRPAADICRLIVDSRLPWAVEPIDGNTSWIYLPAPARLRTIANCLVLTAAQA
jgi:hypothetical protein